MLSGNERLIVVLGMAHSGTTILTYVLKQHPDVVLAVDGYEAWILENTLLPRENAEPIQDLLDANPGKFVLFKRPWNEVHHAEWMQRQMPHAKFIYCHREFEEIAISWSKRNSFVDSRLRNGGALYQRLFYRMCKAKAEQFRRSVQFWYSVGNTGFIQNAKNVMEEIVAWAGLPPFEFDLSAVSADKNIKRILGRRRRPRLNVILEEGP